MAIYTSESEEVFLELREANTKYSIRVLELEKENAELKKQIKRMDVQLKCGECGNVVLWHDQVHYLDIIKKKCQIIEKAEKALNDYAIADDVGAIARRYFKDKQKDEVKE